MPLLSCIKLIAPSLRVQLVSVIFLGATQEANSRQRLWHGRLAALHPQRLRQQGSASRYAGGPYGRIDSILGS